MENKQNCANCQRELDVGVDAGMWVDGVMGTKDFIPLENMLLFCCDQCHRDYFDIGSLPSVSPRIPK